MYLYVVYSDFIGRLSFSNSLIIIYSSSLNKRNHNDDGVWISEPDILSYSFAILVLFLLYVAF